MAFVRTSGNMMTAVEVQHILCPICHKFNLRRALFCQHCGNSVVLNSDGPRYYITRIIKAGGQGAVYETIGDDGQVYAVKEMLDRFTDLKEREEAINRFDDEAQILQRLSHPRIPHVYANFKDEGRQYLAMDFVRGQDLEQIIEHEGTIPELQALEWADQICDVLGYLHNNGLIYRDMKPSNIMVESQSRGIKLVDFGIAKVLQPSERGTQIGTPGYAPPEQYQGLATRESDIYALGATLHHMVTGRDPRDEVPFSFPPVQSLKPSVSKRTSDAIARALQMRPDDRYHSVAEFRALLRPLRPQPAQVRRVPVTPALPIQPQVAARPAPQLSVPSEPPAPLHTQNRAAARGQTPQHPAKTRTSPSTRRKRGVWGTFVNFVRTLLVTLIILVLIAATLAFAFPNVVEQYLPGVLPTLSRPISATHALMPHAFTAIDRAMTVPASMDQQAPHEAMPGAITQLQI